MVAQPAAKAAYHFYPVLDAANLDGLQQCSTGTLLYPDAASTLVIGCQIGIGAGYILHGPGILGQQTIQLDGIPADFWLLRSAVCRYPLGWDVDFVDEQRIVGLPRSVQVERSST